MGKAKKRSAGGTGKVRAAGMADGEIVRRILSLERRADEYRRKNRLEW